MVHQNVGSRRSIAIGDHALLLAGQHQGHSRVERPGPEDHGRHDLMGVIMIVWCLVDHGRPRPRPASLPPMHARPLARRWTLDGQSPIARPRIGKQVDPLGFVGARRAPGRGAPAGATRTATGGA